MTASTGDVLYCLAVSSAHIQQGHQMTGTERTLSFWRTLPGVLTALATVVTAIGGLLAILFQLGLIANTSDPPSSPAAAQSRVVPATTATTGTTTGKGWQDAEAVITANNGKVTKMRAEVLRYCFSGGAGMYVNESQNIAFEKMTRIDVLRSDVALSAGGRASLRIAFVDGSTMEATITSGCSFFGETAQGRFELYPDRLKSIEFIR
jgi:hypothetical protein